MANVSFGYTIQPRVFSTVPTIPTFGGVIAVNMTTAPYQPTAGLTPLFYSGDTIGAFWGLTGAYNDFPLLTGYHNYPVGLGLRQFWGFTVNRAGIFDYKYMPAGTGTIAKSACDSDGSTPFSLPGTAATPVTRGRWGLYACSVSGGNLPSSPFDYFRMGLQFPPLGFVNRTLTASPTFNVATAKINTDDFNLYSFQNANYPVLCDTFAQDVQSDPSLYNSVDTQGIMLDYYPRAFGNPTIQARLSDVIDSGSQSTKIVDSLYLLSDGIHSAGGAGQGATAIHPLTGDSFMASFLPAGLPFGSTAVNAYTICHAKLVPTTTIQRSTFFQIQLGRVTDQSVFSGNGWNVMNLPGGGVVFWITGQSYAFMIDNRCQNYYLLEFQGAALPAPQKFGFDLNGICWMINASNVFLWSGGKPVTYKIQPAMLGKMVLSSAGGRCMTCVPWLGGPTQ